ncbi:MAG: FkbM family methyltransferase [Pelagibacteraceae bacterium]|nr:FkbM family methyltransferase [Pelagibacteraceae bacterium]
MRENNKNLKTINTKFGKIVININDQFIGKSFLNQKYWGLQDVEIISKIVEFKCKKKNKIVFYDVGANIGTHSIALSNIFKNRIVIRAFEAQSNIYEMFNQSIRINNLNNIELYHNAVSDKNDEIIKIDLPDYSKHNNFGGLELFKPFQNSDNAQMQKTGIFEDVKTIKLDIFNEEVDFIKIDVEGMENLVLKGSENLIVNHRPFLFMELLKSKLEDITDFFKDKDYTIYSKGMDAFVIPVESKVNFKGLQKLL